jgi:inhibitor of Bruton tyrosine kinase
MSVNLETLLEQRMLDDVPHRLVKQLAAFTRQKQAEKSLVSRTTVSFDILREKYAEWLAGEDFPEPIIRSNQPQRRGSNIETKRSLRGSSEPADTLSIAQRTIRRPPSGEDIFLMDEVAVSPMTRDVGSAPLSKGVWKAHSIPRLVVMVLLDCILLKFQI